MALIERRAKLASAFGLTSQEAAAMAAVDPLQQQTHTGEPGADKKLQRVVTSPAHTSAQKKLKARFPQV